MVNVLHDVLNSKEDLRKLQKYTNYQKEKIVELYNLKSYLN